MKIILVTFGILFIFCTKLNAQQLFSLADSVQFETLKDDTTQLRSIIAAKRGEKFAAKAQNRLGYLAFKSGKYDAAEKEFQESLKGDSSFSESNEASYFVGRIARIKGDQQKAKQQLQRYLQKENYGVWAEGAHFFYIKTLLDLQDSSEAVPEMRKFLSNRTKSEYANHVQYYLVKHFRESGDYAKAIVEARALIQNYPETNYAKDLQYQIGDFYNKLGNNAKAKEHFQYLVDNNPKNTEPAAIAQFLLAEIYQKEGNTERARSEYKKVKFFNGNISNWSILSQFAGADLVYKDSRAQSDTIKQKEAQYLFEKFVRDYSTDKRTPRAYLTLANIYIEEERYDEAIISYNKIVEFNVLEMTNVAESFRTKEISSHNLLVEQTILAKAQLFAVKLKQKDLALQEYDILLKKNPLHIDALLGKAKLLADTGDIKGAKSLLSQLIDKSGPLQEYAKTFYRELQERGEE